MGEDEKKPVEEKKKKERKGKKKRLNKPTSKKYSKYKIEAGKIVRAKICHRCGPGIFLMDAGNRLYCGKCHFTEFLTKK